MFKITALVLALALPGAACLSSATKNAVEQAADTCAKQDLDQVASETGQTILDTVEGILAAGVASWEGELVSLGLKYGPAAISCATQIAEALFDAKAVDQGSGSSAASTADGVDYAAAAARARSFAASHPVAQ